MLYALGSIGISSTNSFLKLTPRFTPFIADNISITRYKEKVQLILVMSREAKLYLLDEPIGGVDPASRDYILKTIINQYSEDASVIISTHLIADIESVLNEVVFLKYGQIELQGDTDNIRQAHGKSIDKLFREMFHN